MRSACWILQKPACFTLSSPDVCERQEASGKSASRWTGANFPLALLSLFLHPLLALKGIESFETHVLVEAMHTTEAASSNDFFIC